MKKISFFSYLFIAFNLILIIVGISFTIIYSGSEVRRIVTDISKTQTTILELFTDSVKKDLKFGNYPEIYRKCNSLMQKAFVDSIVVLDMNKKFICHTGPIGHDSLEQFVFFDNQKKQIAGVVKFRFKPLDLESLSSLVFTKILKIVLIILIISFLFVFIFVQLALRGLKNTSDLIVHLDFDNYSTSAMKPSNFKEIYQLQVSIGKMLMQLKELKNKQLDLEVQKTTWQVSRQIAHDIRSPLEALRSVAGHINELDCQHRKIIANSIQRISDIASGLLREGKDIEKINYVNLNILVEEVFLDKTIEYGDKIKSINYTNYQNSFVKGDENSLYRVFSNIINNAFESYGQSSGDVIIKLRSDESFVTFSIEDFGIGMTSDFIVNALEGGVTTKEKGNGLGLSSAKTEILKFSGDFKIDSTLNRGTKIEMKLPRVTCPDWFASSIEIDDSYERIVCIDDDPDFLELYQERLKDYKNKIILVNVKNLDKFLFSDKYQYFFDYDLGKEKTGLEIILDNNISRNSTLVTSMYQDEEIQLRCKKNGIKILPKQIFNTAEVKLKTIMKDEVVFIDNDELMHLSWKMEASKKNINLNVYFSVDDFLTESASYSSNTKIFIDSDLGNGKRGEIESEKIFKQGFTQLYLATGYLASDIDKPEWIIEVVGKRPNFITKA